MYIIRRNRNGAYGWNFLDNFSISQSTGMNAISAVNSSLEVYPNPCTSFATVKMKETAAFPCTLEILDMTGKLVCRKQISTAETLIPASEFGKGIYLFKVTDLKGEISLEKVVLQ